MYRREIARMCDIGIGLRTQDLVVRSVARSVRRRGREHLDLCRVLLRRNRIHGRILEASLFNVATRTIANQLAPHPPIGFDLSLNHTFVRRLILRLILALTDRCL